MMEQDNNKRVTISEVLAYAAPAAGSWFFYIPMWSILPGIYGKYFGLSLTSIAAVVLCIRLFDGVADTAVGYTSDWLRSRGGSRKPWAIIGGLGSVVACYFLFSPPRPATSTYYLLASMAYFLAFTIIEIPHLTWGSELTSDYHRRARIYGLRNMLQRLGMTVFYILPLLPVYKSAEYTPEMLHDAVYVGGSMMIVGLVWMVSFSPPGVGAPSGQTDSVPAFVSSITKNGPLLLYFSAFACVGLCCGMWFGLVYIYLDSYLMLGEKVASMFLTANIISALSTPFWLMLIRKTGKARAWAVAISLFVAQLAATWFIAPGIVWWIPFLAIVLANLCFCCYDVSAISILGDIVDYGKLKFRRDRGTTYFAFNTLIFKIGLGIGGGVALGIAGLLGYSPSETAHTALAVTGLKVAFILLPACFAVAGLLLVLRLPIDERRHGVIQRRLQLLNARRRERGRGMDSVYPVELRT